MDLLQNVRKGMPISFRTVTSWSYSYRRATWLSPTTSRGLWRLCVDVSYSCLCRLYKFPSKVYRQNTDIYTTRLRSIDQSYDLRNAHPLLVKIHKVTWSRNHGKLSIGCYPSQAGVHTLSLKWHWHGREPLLLTHVITVTPGKLLSGVWSLWWQCHMLASKLAGINVQLILVEILIPT